MAEGQGTGEGTGNGTGTGTGEGQGSGHGAEGLGWRAGLPDDLKENEVFTAHKTVGELGKAHLEVLGKAKDFEGKLKGAIFKPGDNASSEEVAAFRKGIGVPDKAEDYVFSEVEGVKNSPETIQWARGVFHKAGLNKDQAGIIGSSWNDFVKQMGEAQDKSLKEAEEAAVKKAKEELGGEEGYKNASELVTRLLKETATEGELQHLQDSGVGNDPVVVRLIFNMAKKTGEDLSPKGKSKGGSGKKGFIYDKSPAPPNNS